MALDEQSLRLIPPFAVELPNELGREVARQLRGVFDAADVSGDGETERERERASERAR